MALFTERFTLKVAAITLQPKKTAKKMVEKITYGLSLDVPPNPVR